MWFKSILKGLGFIVFVGAAVIASWMAYNTWYGGPINILQKPEEKVLWMGEKPAPETIAPGAYLAALNAVFNDDLKKAADYYLQVLQGDPENEKIQREAYFFNAILGNFESLRAVVEELPSDYQTVFFTDYVKMGYALHDEDWAKLRNVIKTRTKLPLDEIIVPLLSAWSYVGEGNYEAAMKALLPLKRNKELAPYYHYHGGLIALALGREFAADEAFQQLAEDKLLIVSMYPEIISFYISRGQWQKDNPFYVQWQLFLAEQPATAELILLRPSESITAKRGAAEVFYNLSTAMGSSKSSYEGALILSALSLYLNPNQELPKVWSAEILEQTQKPQLAAHYYSQMLKGITQTVDFKKAMNLISCGRNKEAKALLLQLQKTNKNSTPLWWALAGIYQGEKNWPAAVQAYTRILEIVGESDSKYASDVYFARSFVYGAQKNRRLEEKDLQHALDLNPDNPMLLNHLGYYWLENDTTLDKGMALVEKAYKLKKSDPHIIDSMAFAFYRKGDYVKALPLAEKTVDIMPQSSVANAHLGDIYKALGRHREAVFQYKKALSLKYDLTPELRQELLHKVATKE